MNTQPKPKNPYAVMLGKLGGRKPGCKGRPLDPVKARAMVAIREANRRAKKGVQS